MQLLAGLRGRLVLPGGLIRRATTVGVSASLLATVGTAVALAAHAGHHHHATTAAPKPVPDVTSVRAAAPIPGVATATPPVAPLHHRVRADVLVTAARSLPPAVVRTLDHLHVTAAATTLEVGALKLNNHPVHAVAVNPSQFRAFAPPGTAESTALWQAVARGDVVVSHATARALHLVLGGNVQVVTGGGAVQMMRIGAFATTIPDADVLVNDSLAAPLGLHPQTGILLSAGKQDPLALAAAVRSVVGSRGTIDLLSNPTQNPTAFLTGSRAASAFGAFSYHYYPDGTIAPDPAWVAANIRTEVVPILGAITCHRLMFHQLRGALQEVVARGLASKVHSYDGCYVPRFIERNPTNSISLHTWGIAIDINAAENPLNGANHQDPRVVAIFKKWGFVWGGDWTSPHDAMHFQIGALLQ
ncbi:MAG: M15 family metallopeptidase [Actinomycetes bacterium]